ncbi:MAG: DUF4359 domain-containing protein [Cyanobacteria bacterium]|nr:DUF4359 domain-containing protein [Cyanobacteriota bacterium]
MSSPFSSRWSWLVWPGLISAAAASLAWSNPPPEEFEDFAADQLVNLAVKEVCGPQGLPMLLQLVALDCPKLMLSQRQALGSLARQASRRWNFGLFSLYRTDLGGQPLLPGFTVPRYRALSLAGAGQFLVLQTETAPGSAP